MAESAHCETLIAPFTGCGEPAGPGGQCNRHLARQLGDLPGEKVWQAVLSDNLGFVLSDEDIREWATDPDAYEIRSDLIPETLAIVSRSAAPDNGERSGHPRLPGSYSSADRFMELDVDIYSPEEVVELWNRAQAAAAAMNAAGVR